jgi:hypothetical protein
MLRIWRLPHEFRILTQLGSFLQGLNFEYSELKKSNLISPLSKLSIYFAMDTSIHEYSACFFFLSNPRQ